MAGQSEAHHTARRILKFWSYRTCTAHNYDIDSKHTASLPSYALGIPFIAINRPDYGGTTTLGATENYHLDCAHWLHELALPAVWAKFGTGCSSIVITAHSMGAGVAIIAGALRADEGEASQKYPLAGIILSGYGSRANPDRGEYLKMQPLENYPPVLRHPDEIRVELMLSKPTLALCDEEMYSLVIEQNVGMRREELWSGIGWLKQPDILSKYCGAVSVPVLFGIGEFDWLCDGTQAHIDEVKGLFSKCPRFEGSVVGSGPHALEWAKSGQGWYLKCFGWAVEVTADAENRSARSKI